ncbi:MAG: hypothetical protein RBG13Loki_2428 [Promethearchaeota archaeon CR_4]|nr:MAG: hypothetical protein RBG13Loki_2428 [Candidatus Lokiarchaeota archaeon CR_4]
MKDFLTSLPTKDQVVVCILTHGHEDHAGRAKMISEDMGIPVYIHPKGAHFVQQGHTLPDYGQIAWGERLLPVPLVQVLPAYSFTTKSRRYHFDLISMPGHAPCLVALIEKMQQWAFVADAVQPKYQMIERAQDGHKLCVFKSHFLVFKMVGVFLFPLVVFMPYFAVLVIMLVDEVHTQEQLSITQDVCYIPARCYCVILPEHQNPL